MQYGKKLGKTMTLPLNNGIFGLNFFINLVKQHFCVHRNFLDADKKLPMT